MNRKLIFLSVLFTLCASLSWAQTQKWNLSPTMTATLDNGTLSISTTASSEAMPDYLGNNRPWGDVCNNIYKVDIANKVTSIGNCAFGQCNNLSSVTIPNSVTSIGRFAFLECNNLSSITIPNSVTSIGDQAFFDCYNLSSITIPSLVTSIEDFTFWGCYKLTSLTIPNSVTSIGFGAFGHSGLISLTIPSSVTYIAGVIVDECPNLTSITVEWLTPLLNVPPRIFGLEDYTSKLTLYVPPGTKALYQAHPAWGKFGTIDDGTPEVNAPTLSATSITDITETSATLNGWINPQGSTTAYLVQFSKSQAFVGGQVINVPADNAVNIGAGNSNVPISQTGTGLTPNTNYWVRIMAMNASKESVYSNVLTFKTADNTPVPPTLSATNVTGITETSAMLNGWVNPQGSTTAYLVQFSISQAFVGGQVINVPADNAVNIGAGNSNVPVSQTGTGLTPNTNYWVRITATNATMQPVYSNVLTFKTAQRQEPASYTVTFDAVGGIPIPMPQTVQSGGKATQPPTPSRTGYQFLGWYHGANLWDFANDAVTGNITLTALWTPIGGNSPTLMATGITDVTATSATINGWINPQGSTTAYVVQFSEIQTFVGGQVINVSGENVGSGNSNVNVSKTSTELQPATYYWTRIIASNASSEQVYSNVLSFRTKANLRLISEITLPANMMLGQSYPYTFNVQNFMNRDWFGGSFYLRDGNTDIDSWRNIDIRSNASIMLSGIYTPTSTGTKTFLLYYQTNSINEVEVVTSNGFSNPKTVTVSQPVNTVDIRLNQAMGFGQSTLTKGQTYTFTAQIRNFGNDAWSGGIYLKIGNNDIDAWSRTITAGGTTTLSCTYTPTTTGQQTFTLYYATGDTGAGTPIPGNGYANPIIITVNEPEPNAVYINVTPSGSQQNPVILTGSNNASRLFNVSSNIDWEVTSNASSWLSVSKNPNNTSFSANARSENRGNPRDAVITVSGTGVNQATRQTINIRQETLTTSSNSLYKLPFPCGTTYLCSQSNRGSTSHTGTEEFAFDFRMSTGSIITAARGGTVSIVETGFTQNFPPECTSNQKNSGNRVVIDHGDGTSALYLHLAHNGALVKRGDVVKQGQEIALSGNTGCSTGPHLHFMVMRTGSSWYNQSLACSFSDVTDNNGVPVANRNYTSGNCDMGTSVETPDIRMESNITGVPATVTVGQRVTFNATVKNYNSTNWNIAFYLKDGNDDVWALGDFVRIGSGQSYTIQTNNSFIVPDRTGKRTWTLHYWIQGTPRGDIVKAFNNNSNQVTVQVNQGTPMSSDASLSSLNVSQGNLSPSFSPTNYTYNVNVVNTVSSITISATQNHENARVLGIGTKTNLKEGPNPFLIEVTAANGIAKNGYTVIVNRASATPDRITLSAPSPAIQKVDLSWNAIEGVKSYDLYRGGLSIPMTYTSGSSQPGVLYVVDRPIYDREYSYQVMATLNDGSKVYSNQVKVNFTFSSPKLATLQGFVRDRDGNPVESAIIYEKNNQFPATYSNEKGEFKFEGVPAGSSGTLIVSKAGYSNFQNFVSGYYYNDDITYTIPAEVRTVNLVIVGTSSSQANELRLASHISIGPGTAILKGSKQPVSFVLENTSGSTWKGTIYFIDNQQGDPHITNHSTEIKSKRNYASQQVTVGTGSNNRQMVTFPQFTFSGDHTSYAVMSVKEGQNVRKIVNKGNFNNPVTITYSLTSAENEIEKLKKEANIGYDEVIKSLETTGFLTKSASFLLGAKTEHASALAQQMNNEHIANLDLIGTQIDRLRDYVKYYEDLKLFLEVYESQSGDIKRMENWFDIASRLSNASFVPKNARNVLGTYLSVGQSYLNQIGRLREILNQSYGGFYQREGGGMRLVIKLRVRHSGGEFSSASVVNQIEKVVYYHWLVNSEEAGLLMPANLSTCSQTTVNPNNNAEIAIQGLSETTLRRGALVITWKNGKVITIPITSKTMGCIDCSDANRVNVITFESGASTAEEMAYKLTVKTN